MSSPSRVVRTCLGLALAPLIAACHILSDSTSETSPTPTTTEVFSGTLDQRGANFYTFTVTQAGTVSVTLTSVGGTTSVPVQLGVGTPNGTTSCTITSANQSVVAGPDAQMSVTENPGSYCVQIADIGNLSASSAFSITIVHP